MAVAGPANVASALFGGIAVTGTIARTATNVRAGAKSPVAGMLHALFLLGFMVVAGPLASYVPLAALAGILVVVAWNMAEKKEFASLLTNWRAAVVLLATFGLTLARDLTAGILAGCLLAAMFWLGSQAASPVRAAMTVSRRMAAPGAWPSRHRRRSGRPGRRGPAIRVIADMEAAWNRGDFRNYMAGFRTPGIFVSRAASRTAGRARWTTTSPTTAARRKRRGALHFSDIRIEMLSPDAAQLISRYDLIRPKDPQHGINTRLMRKVGGRWVIALSHVSARRTPEPKFHAR